MITKQIDHSNGRFQLDIITNENKFDSLTYGGECKLFDSKNEAVEFYKQIFDEGMDKLFTIGQAHPQQKRLNPGFYMRFYAL
jgi:hypothetical protein